jgi:hypothetical protein
MRFDHLIEINEPLNPLLDWLSREQLWRGLQLRAEDPMQFVLALDDCRILSRSTQGVQREYRFGSLLIRDQVLYDTERSTVRYRTEFPPELAGSLLSMAIEEPEPGRLFVRFVYDDDDCAAQQELLAANDPQTAAYQQMRRAAWEQADVDTIRNLRRLAAQSDL